MARPKQTADLVAVSLEALDRYEERQDALGGDKTRPPAPGDIYVLSETRDYDVEWVLVAHDPASPERFLAVPGDVNPLKGSADIALADGSLRLRSRFALWIDARILDLDLRVGTVAAVDVKQTRQLWLDIGDGKATGTVLAREVDDDPEYQDWCEDVLGPARQRLVEALETKGDDVSDESKGVVVPFRRLTRFMTSGVAASLALAMTGGLALLLWRSNERVQNLEAANRRVEERHREELREVEAERDRMEAERVRMEEVHRRELEQVSEENEQTEQQYREQIATLGERLKEARKPADVVNPAVEVFDPPDMTTRGRKKVTISPGASHVVLFFALRERAPAPRYRLVLRERGEAAAIWSNDRLTLEEPGEIRVGLPAAILVAGEYELELSRLEDDAFNKIADYELEVVAGSIP